MCAGYELRDFGQAAEQRSVIFKGIVQDEHDMSGAVPFADELHPCGQLDGSRRLKRSVGNQLLLEFGNLTKL